MKIVLRMLWGLLVLLLTEVAPGFAQNETEHQHQVAVLVNRPGRHDPQLRKRFLADYNARREADQLTFSRYFSSLGADGILDAMEQQYPLCHSEVHDLGRAIFAQLQELGPALQVCGNRCNSGCMHGVMREAFAGDAGHEHHGHHLTLAEIKPKIKTLCGNKTVSDTYASGDCAHGVGHALLALSGYNLGEALHSCSVFESAPLTYYCATGVFMEYEERPRPAEQDNHSLHYPCETYTQFPAACYRYRARFFLTKFHGNVAAVAEECLRLEPLQRRGCFYGLGNAHMSHLTKQPEQLRTICEHGDTLDQVMCINGAIETLVDYQPESATKACAVFTDERATACSTAMRNKRYGLEKDFTLYYRQ